MQTLTTQLANHVQICPAPGFLIFLYHEGTPLDVFVDQVKEGQNTLAHEETQISSNICDEVVGIICDELIIHVFRIIYHFHQTVSYGIASAGILP